LVHPRTHAIWKADVPLCPLAGEFADKTQAIIFDPPPRRA
jgi:hypothetical protein